MDLKPKSFIKRVFDFARAELERRAGQSELSEPFAAGTPESGDSASFARELESDAQAASADSFARELKSGAQAASSDSFAREPESDAQAASSDARGSRPPVAKLEVARRARGALKVRWSVGAGEIDRSAQLLDEGAVLCLRLVSFETSRDHVLREVQDRPSIAPQGECDIARPEGRAVVALGLRAGGRFVSIAHHVV